MQLHERMRSIHASAIALSGQLSEVPRSGTERTDRASGPPLSGNGAKRNFRLTPGGLAKWRMGDGMAQATTSVEGRRRLLVSTPTDISLNRLLCDVCPDVDNTLRYIFVLA